MKPDRIGVLLVFAAACRSGSRAREPESHLLTTATGCMADQALSLPPQGTRINGFTIPAAHPRLWWNMDRLESAKTWLASHPMKPIDEHPTPEELVNVALLHAVTGASCKPAIDWVMEYEIRDDAFAVASDEVRWHGELAILVFDWCHDELDAARRAVLIDRWNGYLEKSMQGEWGGETMPSNNYFWGFLRNQLEWGIATHGENPAAKKFLTNAINTRWRDGFLAFASSKAGAGGVPQEGTQYGGYMLDYPIIPFDTISLLGRSLYDETEFFKGSVLWLLYATTPAATTPALGDASEFEVFPFNDDEKWNNHASAKTFINFMTSAAMTWRCKAYGGYSRTWL
ncbi:MAG: hypothetical protein H0T79_20960, partial [Deltaproteobacteria bacterium]|nr:hypothetical protein [Deltaproteobacteria bacterium]